MRSYVVPGVMPFSLGMDRSAFWSERYRRHSIFPSRAAMDAQSQIFYQFARGDIIPITSCFSIFISCINITSSAHYWTNPIYIIIYTIISHQSIQNSNHLWILLFIAENVTYFPKLRPTIAIWIHHIKILLRNHFQTRHIFLQCCDRGSNNLNADM